MKYLYEIQKAVKDILETNIPARDSDSMLYALVAGKFNEIATNMPFKEVMSHPHEYGIPTFDTVSRLRRKVQNDCPELKAHKEVTEAKYQKFKDIHRFMVVEGD